VSLLTGLLEPDVNKRLSSAEAAKHHWFVNEKSKSVIMKGKPKILPSLKTI
jgi:serine/threonine protein kinase